MARDPNGFLTGVRQIALVKMTFIVKRATIRVEAISMRYVNSKLLQLVKHSFFVVGNISNVSVFHFSIASTPWRWKCLEVRNSLQRGQSYSWQYLAISKIQLKCDSCKFTHIVLLYYLRLSCTTVALGYWSSSSSANTMTLISKMSSTSTNSCKITPENLFGFNFCSWQYLQSFSLVSRSQSHEAPSNKAKQRNKHNLSSYSWPLQHLTRAWALCCL